MNVRQWLLLKSGRETRQARYLPWLGVIALGLGLGFTQSQVLPPLQQELALLSGQVAEMPEIVPIRPLPVANAPRDVMAKTLAQFPEIKQAPQVWMKLESLAEKNHIPFAKQSYEWQDENDLPLTRMILPLAIKANESDLRQFLLEAKASVPSLMLPQMNLKRSRSLDRQLDADLQLVVYFRRSS